jgi:hypothetical protein
VELVPALAATIPFVSGGSIHARPRARAHGRLSHPAVAASSMPGLALALAAAIPSGSGGLVHARLPLALAAAIPSRSRLPSPPAAASGRRSHEWDDMNEGSQWEFHLISNVLETTLTRCCPHEMFPFSLLHYTCKSSISTDVAPYLMCIKPHKTCIETGLSYSLFLSYIILFE